MGILLNKGSPKSHHSPSLPTLLPLKEIIFYEDEEENEEEEDWNRFDPPPIFDDYGDNELLKFEDYGDEELWDGEELGETKSPLSSCEEEGQVFQEELHLPLYKDSHHQDNEIIFDPHPWFDEHDEAGQGSCEV